MYVVFPCEAKFAFENDLVMTLDCSSACFDSPPH